MEGGVLMVKLSLGYDTERPHGTLAQTTAGKLFRKEQLLYVRRLLDLLDKLIAPRTLFILGDYLERCLDQFSIEYLRETYNPANHLNDLQQHSYSHKPLRKLRGFEGLVLNSSVMSIDEFTHDLERANRIISEILGVVPCGLRTPYGYERDLSDMPEMLRRLKSLGLNFVSSKLRSRKNPLYAQLSLESQPHTYAEVGFPDIVEIPSHGWQDVIFTTEKALLFLHRKPDKPGEIFQYYSELFRKASDLSEYGQPIYLCLCLHPWSAMEYDPELEIIRKTIEMARSMEIEIVSYRQVAEEIDNQGRKL